MSTAVDLCHGRMQMAVSLGWHIVIASFGVGFPAMVVFAEWRSRRRGDADLESLAHTWAPMSALSRRVFARSCWSRRNPGRWRRRAATST
jgi:cytochrome bd-type quinol oxidase subunit 1